MKDNKEIEKMVTFTEAEVEYLVDVMTEQMTARCVFIEDKRKIIESVFRKIVKLLN